MTYSTLIKTLENWFHGVGEALSLLLSSMLWIPHSAWRMRREIGRQLQTSALGGMPVVLIVSFFSGAVLALQLGREMMTYGMESNIGRMVAIAMCREMGPVMTGIILAGLLGSKLASEIGTMNVSEEISALKIMSIPPDRFLVMPRILTMLLVVPALTIYADLIGIIGGGFVSSGVMNVDMAVYIEDVKAFLELNDIYVGLVKSVVFGGTIGIVGCYQGFQARHGARGVGNVTMRSVVIGMLYIIIFNYFIGWMFFGS